MTTEDIRDMVAHEFGAISSRFRSQEHDLAWALCKPTPRVGLGVYVFLRGDKVIKVGKSSTRDVCGRAIEHVRDNTGGQMSALSRDETARLLFFVADAQDEHWVLALENYLERRLQPSVRANRRS